MLNYPNDIKVVMTSPEIAPFAKTGGLGDVLATLPQALEKLGVQLTLIMPAYREVLQGGWPLEDTGVTLSVPVSKHREEGTLLKAITGHNIKVYFVRADSYFDRQYLYGTSQEDYKDNAERFIFFARAILEVLKLEPPAILHAHDWQSALAVAFLKTQSSLYPELSSVKTVFTVHNLGYQGIFQHPDWHLLDLDESFFSPQYLEFYGKINFLKGGLIFSDVLTTVSRAYAEEIKTPDYGFGLDDILRKRSPALFGILNGIDYDIWDPETDPCITRNYSLANISGKQACKTELQKTMQLEENPDIPLFCMVSRLACQKGYDLLEQCFRELIARGIQFVQLGNGDACYKEFLHKLMLSYPGKVSAEFQFDEELSHKVIAGSDFVLMPSQYEPGGLTHLYGLKYGDIPIVRFTGGLKDTVADFDPQTGRGIGFTFDKYDTTDFLSAVERALAIFRQKDKWQILMQNAMSVNFSWQKSANSYLELYKNLVASCPRKKLPVLGK